jgi:HrpA-like RNA helicase
MRDLRAAIIAKQNVLIFVPGKKEIQNYIEEIRQMYGDGVEVFPLHAEMPASQQNILLTKNTDKPRIIVATNIAEESITIPYIDRVMDLGQIKILRYDAHGTPILCLEDTAMSNVLQRA